ncbi:ArdC family protein [Sphaerisporangium sp. NPDC004334]
MARTTSKPRRRRPQMTEEERAAWKARKAARVGDLKELQRAAAMRILTDPAAAHTFVKVCASIGAGSYEGAKYTLRNAVLLWGQNPAISHVGSFDYWREQGRRVRKGTSERPTKALGIFVYIGKDKDKDAEEGKPREEAEHKAEDKRPKYKVSNGTYDVRSTIPIETCIYCGTNPPEDPTGDGCPADCAVFDLRPGIEPPLEEVYAVAFALAEDDGDEDGEDGAVEL